MALLWPPEKDKRASKTGSSQAHKHAATRTFPGGLHHPDQTGSDRAGDQLFLEIEMVGNLAE